MLQAVMIGITGVFLALFLKQTKPEYAVCVSVGTGLLLLILAGERLSLVVENIRLIQNAISIQSAYIQVLLIFGGLLALWNRRKEPVKKQILWLLTAAVGMVTFFYTREDAIWVEPFLIVFVLVYLGNMFAL